MNLPNWNHALTPEVDEQVFAVAAAEHVGAQPADQDTAAEAAVEAVVAGAAQENVVGARAAGVEHVVAGVAVNDGGSLNVAGPEEEPGRPEFDPVRAGLGGDRVAAVSREALLRAEPRRRATRVGHRRLQLQ